jgi:hypothetical protein
MITMDEMLKDAVVLFKGIAPDYRNREFWIFQKGQSLTCAVVEPDGFSTVPNDGGTSYHQANMVLRGTVDCTTHEIKWFPTSGKFIAYMRKIGRTPGQYQGWHKAYDWAMKEYA